MAHTQAASWVLLLAAATLFWMALTDLRSFKIRNEAVVCLAVLYVAYTAASGQWSSALWNIGFAAVALAVMVYLYAQEKMGGGDLKLLAVAFLWTGPFLAAPFAFLLLVFVGIHYAAARFDLVASRNTSSGLTIPLAPSIAAALIAVFALGLVAPA